MTVALYTLPKQKIDATIVKKLFVHIIYMMASTFVFF